MVGRSRAVVDDPDAADPVDPLDPLDPVDPGMNSKDGNPMRRHGTSGLFSSKGPPNFHDFQGETQGRGLGEPQAGPSPRGAQGEPKVRVVQRSKVLMKI